MASNATSYADAADLLLYHDARRIGDLVSDNDVRVSATALLTNPIVHTLLERASGKVEMAAQLGGKYKPTDLANMTGVAREALTGIVCDLCVWELEKRRARGIKYEDVPGAQEAHDVLTALAEGELIFPTDEALSAIAIEAVEDEAALACAGNDSCAQRYGRTVNAFRRFFGRRGGECC